MTANGTTLHCTRCGEALYQAGGKKIFFCPHCGAEVRENPENEQPSVSDAVRRSLLDTAYRRLDSALFGLLECQKLDAGYVGTLIAGIAYETITAVTPGACPEEDRSLLFAQLKKNCELLRTRFPTVSDEELALYDSLGEPDVHATLLPVYAMIGDTVREACILSLLDVGGVRDETVSGDLLSYAIRCGHTDMVEQILSGTKSIPGWTALSEILMKHPEGDRKTALVRRLLAAGIPADKGKPVIDRYLAESPEPTAVKAGMTLLALENGILPEVAGILGNVLREAEEDRILAVVDALCTYRLSDEDALRLADFGISSCPPALSVSILRRLIAGERYLMFPAKLLTAVLNDDSYTVPDKLDILSLCMEEKTERRTLETVTCDYLCNNTAPPAERKSISAFLLQKNDFIPMSTVEAYLFRPDVTGEEKSGNLRLLFEKGLNAGSCSELLIRYRTEGPDDPGTVEEITDIFFEKGTMVDPDSLIAYVCEPSGDLPEKLRFVRRAIGCGAQIRRYTANAYLEGTEPEALDPGLLPLLITPESSFSAEGIRRYLLYMEGGEPGRDACFRTVLENADVSVPSIRASVTHAGNSLECNLLQAYLLTTADPIELAAQIADYLINQVGVNLRADVSDGGRTVSFRRYIGAHREDLSSTALAMCERYNAFSLFH